MVHGFASNGFSRSPASRESFDQRFLQLRPGYTITHGILAFPPPDEKTSVIFLSNINPCFPSVFT
jgi:hypothetical protein